MKTFLKKGERGFTITELVIVIAAVAVLMAILLPTLLNSVAEEKQDAAIGQGRTEWSCYSAVAELPALEEQNYLVEVAVDGSEIYFWIISGSFVEIPMTEKPESTSVTFREEEGATTLTVTENQVNSGEGYRAAYDNVKIYALSEPGA
mgnify:FL=1